MEEVLELRATLAETRRRRLDAERRAKRRGAVEVALAAAERDADAVMSSGLSTLQENTAAMAAEMARAWTTINRTRLHAAKLDARGLYLDQRGGMSAGPIFLKALDAEAAARTEIRARLVAAEVNLLVPDLAPLTVEAHPNRDDVADVFDQITATARERDAHRRRQASSRKDTTHGQR